MYQPRHLAPQPAMHYGEGTHLSPETFISQEGVQHLVAFAMDGRVDPVTSRLLPIEEEHTLIGGPDALMKSLPSVTRNDIVLPGQPRSEPHPGGGEVDIRQDYSVSSAIYKGLTDERPITLGAAEIERLRYERAKLEETFTARPDLEWEFNPVQTQDAYHVIQKDAPAPGSDGQLVSPARIYVPGGKHGVRIMNRIMEAGADFAYAKIWVPHAARGEQAFRQDTPILIANTLEQLRSIVSAVQMLAAEGLLDARMDPPVGIPIEGAPGAFVAQTLHGSFNGEMAKFWAGPITEACNSLPLRAGDIVGVEWIDEAARRATDIARLQAKAADINPACHALASGQDLNAVLTAVRA